jgi:hypothetical protein
MLLTLACKYLLQRVLGYLLGYQNNWISWWGIYAWPLPSDLNPVNV